jgi:RNA polymerase sigma factor (sigma-70 family)
MEAGMDLNAQLTLSDHELLDSYARRGDEQAFAELFSRHSDAVFSTAMLMLRDVHAAEDASQTTFATLARKAPNLAPSVSVAGWLRRTAQLTACDMRKLERRRRRHETQAVSLRACTGISGAAQFENTVLPAALQELPPAERKVMGLRFIEGLSRTDIARTLDCPEGTVQTRVNRGVQRMREILRRTAFAPAMVFMRLSAEFKQQSLCVARMLYWSVAAGLGVCSAISMAASLGLITLAGGSPVSVTIAASNPSAASVVSEPAIVTTPARVSYPAEAQKTSAAANAPRHAGLEIEIKAARFADDFEIGLRSTEPIAAADESIIAAAKDGIVEPRTICSRTLLSAVKARPHLEIQSVNVASLLQAGQNYSATTAGASHVNTERIYRAWLAQSNRK